MERIPIAGPWITEHEVRMVAEAVRTAWYANSYSYNERFERAMEVYVGVRHAVSLPHCTSALHLALAALGVGPGDEVIVPDVTWIATSAPISYVGATPVFADIDPQTWCLDVESFETCITDRTKAVIVVDLYGGMPDYDAILEIADRRGIVVIEDAAEAIGSEYHGRKAGSLGAIGVFSFHGSKTLVTGEGGMLVTDRLDVRDRVYFLRDHGRPPGDKFFFNSEIAFKYRMSSLQAALGLAQLERVAELVERKREIFRWYQEDLADVKGISLNVEPPGTKNSYWMSTVIVDASYGFSKADLMTKLFDKGIDVRPFFHPLSSIPAYRDRPEAASARRRNAVAHNIAGRGINLPSALILTREQVARAASAVRDILSTAAP